MYRSIRGVLNSKVEVSTYRRFFRWDLYERLVFYFRIPFKKPEVALISVIVLAIGLCVNITVFSLINGIILSEPNINSENLLHMEWNLEGGDNTNRNENIGSRDFTYLQENTQSFSYLVGYYADYLPVRDPSSKGYAKRYHRSLVSKDFFRLAGIKALKGRVLNESDIKSREPSPVVISYRLWKEQCHERQDIIGSKIMVGETYHEVVGVMPEGFHFPLADDVWQMTDWSDTNHLKRKDVRHIEVAGSLAEGYTVDDARLEVTKLVKSIADQHPETNLNLTSITIKKFTNEYASWTIRQALPLMFFCAILVLLASCANTSNLLLTRLLAKEREISIRRALGANNRHIFIYVLSDAFFLLCSALIVGVFLAAWLIRFFWFFIEENFYFVPFWWNTDVTSELVLFTVIIFFFSLVLVTISPFLKARSLAANTSLKLNRKAPYILPRMLYMNFSSCTQISFSVMLVILTIAMLIVTWIHIYRPIVNNVDNILLAHISLDSSVDYKTDEDVHRFYREVSDNLSIDNHINNVGFTYDFSGIHSSPRKVEIDIANDEIPKEISAKASIVTPSIFDVLDLEPISGRVFSASDSATSVRVCVIDENFAKDVFGELSPIGKKIRVFRAGRRGEREDLSVISEREKPDWTSWMTVVGVVPSVLGEPTQTESPDSFRTVYIPEAQFVSRYMTLLVEANRDDVPYYENKIREVLRAKSPNLTPSWEIMSIRRFLEVFKSRISIVTIIIFTLAVSAFVVAIVGFYSVLRFFITLRRRELSVRFSLGAKRSDIYFYIFMSNVWPLFVGCILGCGLAYIVSDVLKRILPGVEVLVTPGAYLVGVCVVVVIMTCTMYIVINHENKRRKMIFT